MRALRAAVGFCAAVAIPILLSMTTNAKTPVPLKSAQVPDLEILSPGVENPTCKNGLGFITVKATIKNASTKHAADFSKVPFLQSVRFSVTSSLPPCPQTIIEAHPGGPAHLAPGASAEVKATRCIRPGGTYRLWATADPLKLVSETNEDNNMNSYAFFIPNLCK